MGSDGSGRLLIHQAGAAISASGACRRVARPLPRIRCPVTTRTGPPGKRKAWSASPSVQANPKTTVTTTNQRIQDSADQPRRRRAASWRLPALDSCRRDPWWYEPPTAGYEQAAMHLLELGLPPAPNPEAMTAMWTAGAEGRRLARVIAERWEMAR
jgi:hypothetical protein